MSERSESEARKATIRALEREDSLERFLDEIGVTNWANVIEKDVKALVDELLSIPKK